MYRYLLVAGARSLALAVEAPRAVYAAWCLGAGAGSLSLAVEAPGAVDTAIVVVIVGTIVATLFGLLIVVRRLVLPLGLAVAIVIGGAVGAPDALVQVRIAATHLEVIPLAKERQHHLLVRSASVVIQRMIAGRQDAVGHVHPLQVLHGVVERLLVTLGLLKEGKKALELLLRKSRGAQRAAARALVRAGVGVVRLGVDAGTKRLDAVAARAVEVSDNRKGHRGRLGSLGSNTGKCWGGFSWKIALPPSSPPSPFNFF